MLFEFIPQMNTKARHFVSLFVCMASRFYDCIYYKCYAVEYKSLIKKHGHCERSEATSHLVLALWGRWLLHQLKEVNLPYKSDDVCQK